MAKLASWAQLSVINDSSLLQKQSSSMSYSIEVTHELIYCPGHNFIVMLPPTTSLLLYCSPAIC